MSVLISILEQSIYFQDAKKYRNWYMSASKLARRRNQYTKAMQDVLKRKK